MLSSVEEMNSLASEIDKRLAQFKVSETGKEELTH